MEGSVAIVVPLVMTYGFGEVMVDGVPNLLGVGGGVTDGVGVGGGVIDGVGVGGGGGGGGGGGLDPEVLTKTTGLELAF